MPDHIVITESGSGRIAYLGISSDVYSPVGAKAFGQSVNLAFAPTPDNLIAQARAKVKATLTELTQIPETLDEAQANITTAKLPFMVIVAGDAQDVSSSWAIKSTASQVPIDFVYVGKMTGNGATDTAQSIRARLDLLEDAFLADFTLGGVCVMTEVQSVSSQKANIYQQALADIGERISVMVLSMVFTLVKDR